ncbi:hypothetical protein NX059_000901 [Plenodomus lindquistii]|nr:hypothetical protein NX059_000901 [Plenodomus lindquistii]
MNPYNSDNLPIDIAEILRTGSHLPRDPSPPAEDLEPLTAIELASAADWDDLYDIIARILELLHSARDLWN